MRDQTGCDRCQLARASFAKLTRGLLEKLISRENYALNVISVMAGMCTGCIRFCVGELDEEATRNVLDYIGKVLQPINFEPCVRATLVGTPSQDEVEAKCKALMPKYLAVHQELVNRLEMTQIPGPNVSR